jgi:transcriptional regulator with XRE-family HTH domain
MGHKMRGSPEHRRAAIRMGEQLRELRLGACLTIEELAAKVDEPVAFVERIERGSYVVDPYELEELCSAYGIPFMDAIVAIDSALHEVGE